MPPLPYSPEERGMVEMSGCEQASHHQVLQPQLRQPQLPTSPQRTFVPPCILHGQEEQLDNAHEPTEKLAENCDEGKHN